MIFYLPLLSFMSAVTGITAASSRRPNRRERRARRAQQANPVPFSVLRDDTYNTSCAVLCGITRSIFILEICLRNLEVFECIGPLPGDFTPQRLSEGRLISVGVLIERNDDHQFAVYKTQGSSIPIVGNWNVVNWSYYPIASTVAQGGFVSPHTISRLDHACFVASQMLREQAHQSRVRLNDEPIPSIDQLFSERRDEIILESGRLCFHW